MAFTGDLEHLSIVDIIQLVHTTRKSGIFSVKGDKGESKIVFSHGYIVGANHISDSVRIGTVLVKMGAITLDDLKQAFSATDQAGEQRIPLMVTLMQLGRLKREDAQRGLRKLVEMTIVELMGWTKGTFTFDTDAVVYSPEGAAASGDMEQAVGVDSQMVLMDALRVFDERERDRADGKQVPPFESLYADVLPAEGGTKKEHAVAITADILGLDDLDKLERKIPRPTSDMELFDPVAIHREGMKEMLAGFSPQEQEALVSFLKGSGTRRTASASQQADKAVVLYSDDELLRHSIMTICNSEGIPVFAVNGEAELESTLSQCLSAMRMPVVVFDHPLRSGAGSAEEAIVSLRGRVREKFSAVPLLQLAPPQESGFVLRSYAEGVRAVFPKPAKELRRESFIQDLIRFLGSFRTYLSGFQHQPEAAARYVKKLSSDIRSLRDLGNPSEAMMMVLLAVAEMFERAVLFYVRPAELSGETAMGVGPEKSTLPTSAEKLKVPLAKASVFRDVLERKLPYYGEHSDESLRELYREIGPPLRQAVLLLPVVSDRKVVAVVYGDFGSSDASPVQIDILEILSQQIGMVLENALFRKQAAKAAH